MKSTVKTPHAPLLLMSKIVFYLDTKGDALPLWQYTWLRVIPVNQSPILFSMTCLAEMPPSSLDLSLQLY